MMSTDQACPKMELVMQSVVAKTRNYFESEHGTPMDDVDSGAVEASSQAQLDMTAIVGLGGRVNLWAVFSFQACLVNAVHAWMTVGFQDEPEEVERHRQAAIGEWVNTILGHCTQDFGHLDKQGVPLTPPLMMDPDNVFPEMQITVFSRRYLSSRYGRLNISLVRPQAVFPPGRPDAPR